MTTETKSILKCVGVLLGALILNIGMVMAGVAAVTFAVIKVAKWMNLLQ